MKAINFIKKYNKKYIGIINNIYYDNFNNNYLYYERYIENDNLINRYIKNNINLLNSKKILNINELIFNCHINYDECFNIIIPAELNNITKITYNKNGTKKYPYSSNIDKIIIGCNQSIISIIVDCNLEIIKNINIKSIKSFKLISYKCNIDTFEPKTKDKYYYLNSDLLLDVNENTFINNIIIQTYDSYINNINCKSNIIHIFNNKQNIENIKNINNFNKLIIENNYLNQNSFFDNLKENNKIYNYIINYYGKNLKLIYVNYDERKKYYYYYNFNIHQIEEIKFNEENYNDYKQIKFYYYNKIYKFYFNNN